MPKNMFKRIRDLKTVKLMQGTLVLMQVRKNQIKAGEGVITIFMLDEGYKQIYPDPTKKTLDWGLDSSKVYVVAEYIPKMREFKIQETVERELISFTISFDDVESDKILIYDKVIQRTITNRNLIKIL